MGAIDWNGAPVALVTGGASGIGRASARALAGRGARVAIFDRDEAGRSIAREIGGLFLSVDVSSADAWRAAVETIGGELGPIEIAHLNAGIMTLPPTAALAAASDLANVSEEVYRRIVGVNVDGVVFGLRALLPGMTGLGRGRIVVTASTGGLVPVPFDPLYGMTKHAVIGLVRSLAPVLAAQAISLAALCPGGVDTPLVPAAIRAMSPPLLAPEDVGRAVLTLVDDTPAGDVFVVRPGRSVPESIAAPAIDLS